MCFKFPHLFRIGNGLFREYGFDNRPEVPVQFFRGLLFSPFQPPLNHLYKTSGNMVYEKIIRKRRVGTAFPAQQLHPDQLIQTVLEIAKEDFTAFTGQQSQNVAVIFLKMLEKVAENRFRRIAVGVQTVGVGAVHGAVDNVPE